MSYIQGIVDFFHKHLIKETCKAEDGEFCQCRECEKEILKWAAIYKREHKKKLVNDFCEHLEFDHKKCCMNCGVSKYELNA